MQLVKSNSQPTEPVMCSADKLKFQILCQSQKPFCVYDVSSTKLLQNMFSVQILINIMLFTGQEDRIGKNCARGLEYMAHGCKLRAVLETEGAVFSYMDQTRPVNILFIFS